MNQPLNHLLYIKLIEVFSFLDSVTDLAEIVIDVQINTILVGR